MKCAKNECSEPRVKGRNFCAIHLNSMEAPDTGVGLDNRHTDQQGRRRNHKT